jgi:hypothetical protein
MDVIMAAMEPFAAPPLNVTSPQMPHISSYPELKRPRPARYNASAEAGFRQSSIAGTCDFALQRKRNRCGCS